MGARDVNGLAQQGGLDELMNGRAEFVPVDRAVRAETKPLAPRPKEPPPPLEYVIMSDVPPEQIDWLWPGRIPLGMYSTFEGDMDVGKSTALIDAAARVTTGRPMPGEEGGAEPADVVIWAPEDPASQVIRPRLDVAGADVSRVVLITQPLTLPDDAARLEQLIQDRKAKLVIIEPLTAALSGRVDSHRDQDVRRALMPLVKLATRTGAAVVAIRHLRKGDGSAAHRGMGSVGIGALARATNVIGKDPQDPTARIIARTKGNLAKLPPALRFRFIEVRHAVGPYAKIEWGEEVNLSADDLLAQVQKKTPALQRAMDVLRAILQAGPMAQQDVEEQARTQGVTPGTLRRAYYALDCKATKEPGAKGRWFWRLPIGTKVDDVAQPASQGEPKE